MHRILAAGTLSFLLGFSGCAGIKIPKPPPADVQAVLNAARGVYNVLKIGADTYMALNPADVQAGLVIRASEVVAELAWRALESDAAPTTREEAVTKSTVLVRHFMASLPPRAITPEVQRKAVATALLNGQKER